MEFASGERPNVDSIHRHLEEVRGGTWVRDAVDKSREHAEYRKRKYKERLEDVKKDVKRALADHLEGGNIAWQLKDGSVIRHRGCKKHSVNIERK